MSWQIDYQNNCKKNGSLFNVASKPDERAQQLIYEIVPNRTMSELMLPELVIRSINEVFEENERRELLRSYNLEPRHKILLTGPPGNGKTALAEALSTSLAVPLFVVRYDALIGSYLGETSGRLRRLFDYVRTQHCVLFFDEFDVIGKERGDSQETGEIKRIVSSLLLQIDALPTHVIVVAATNHAELLDRAVWRRFNISLELPPPTFDQAEEWLCRFQKTLSVPLGYLPSVLAERLNASSFSELEEFCADVMRRYVLSMPNSDLKQIVADRIEFRRRRESPVARNAGQNTKGERHKSGK